MDNVSGLLSNATIDSTACLGEILSDSQEGRNFSLLDNTAKKFRIPATGNSRRNPFS